MSLFFLDVILVSFFFISFLSVFSLYHSCQFFLYIPATVFLPISFLSEIFHNIIHITVFYILFTKTDFATIFIVFFLLSCNYQSESTLSCCKFPSQCFIPDSNTFKSLLSLVVIPMSFYYCCRYLSILATIPITLLFLFPCMLRVFPPIIIPVTVFYFI